MAGISRRYLSLVKSCRKLSLLDVDVDVKNCCCRITVWVEWVTVWWVWDRSCQRAQAFTALFKRPDPPGKGAQRGQDATKPTNWNNHEAFSSCSSLGRIDGAVLRSHSEKVTEAIVWEMKDEGLKEKIKRCPPPHLCTPGNLLCDVGVLFGD